MKKILNFTRKYEGLKYVGYIIIKMCPFLLLLEKALRSSNNSFIKKLHSYERYGLVFRCFEL